MQTLAHFVLDVLQHISVNADVGTLCIRAVIWLPKQRTASTLAETQENDKQDDVFVAAPEYLTRSQGSTFDNVIQCIFCEKPFSNRKRASIANDSKSWTVIKTKSRGIE